MLTPAQLKQAYGDPAGKNQGQYMTAWDVPDDIEKAFAHVLFSALGKKMFPPRIFCHRAMATRLEVALRGLMAAGISTQLKTWDGAYEVRKMRGLNSVSLHAYGAAIDLNARENPLGKKPVLSAAFVKCFTDAGLDWGGKWQRPDGMHFQLRDL